MQAHPEHGEEDGENGGKERKAEEEQASPMEIRVHTATPPPPEKSSEGDVEKVATVEFSKVTCYSHSHVGCLIMILCSPGVIP